MRRTISFLLIFTALAANARQVTPEEAYSIASEFFNSSSTSKVKKAPRRAVQASHYAENQSESQPYYIFNAEDKAGFVIIAGDTRAKKILGYSEKGSFDTDNMPPQLKAIMEQYAEVIDAIPESQAENDSWNRKTTQSYNEGILLETANWGQGYPYNSQCPIIDGVQAPTGCVATAMAIVMKYHNWPESGRYKWSYNSDEHTHFSLDYSTSHYLFDSYEDNYTTGVETTSNIENLAKLFFDAGTAVASTYGADETGANIEILGYTLSRFFKYSSNCQCLYSSDYSSSDWNNVLNCNLKNGNPVIYSANDSEKTLGHAFVVDGVKDGLYHINWGWDGAMNGYFALSSLTPAEFNFNSRHQMIINIEPDVSDNEFSEIWLNSGLFRWLDNDYAQTEDVGRGIEISCGNIVPGKSFNVITKCLSGPIDFNGEIALVLVDGNGNVKSTLQSKHLSSVQYPGGFYPYHNVTDAYIWKDVVALTDITESDRLVLMTRREGCDKWLLVKGTNNCPSSIPTKGNNPTLINQIIRYHGTNAEDKTLYEYDICRVGDNINPGVSCKDGIAHLYINGEYWATSSDFGEVIHSYGYRPEVIDVNIDIFYFPYSELKSKDIKISMSGSLTDYLTDEDKLDLYSLKVSGQLNIEDLKVINELHGLCILDLSDASIEGDILDYKIHNLFVFNLPKVSEIKEVDAYLQPSYFSVVVPETMTKLGNLSVRDFLIINSKNPPSINLSSSQQAVILVPYGCLKDYLQNDSYKNKSHIFELDADEYIDCSFNFDSEIVFYNLTSKKCALVDFTYKSGVEIPILTNDFGVEIKNCRYFEFPTEISHNGVSRKTAFVGSNPRFSDNNNLMSTFQGVDVYYIDSDGDYIFNNGPWQNFPLQFVYTSSLIENFDYCEGFFYVPDHSEILGQSSRHNVIYESHKMFSLEKDSKTHRIKITSTMEDITIKSVHINGIEVLPYCQTYYDFDISSGSDITVTYDVHGQHILTTNYTTEFLATIPDTDLSNLSINNVIIDDDIILDSDKVSIYNINGQLVFKGMYSDSSLAKGIYIVKTCNKVLKWIVR